MEENTLVIIFGAIALISGVIVIIQSYKTHKLQREIAYSQGAFKKEIEMKLYAKEDTNSFFMGLPLSKNRALMVPLIFSIKNTGEMSAKNIEIFIRLNKNLCFGGFIKYSFKLFILFLGHGANKSL